MPVGADASRPIRTVDTTGHVISTDTGKAPPVKVVDSVGRAVQEDATKVAEQAAAGNPELPKEPAAPEAEKKPEAARAEGEPSQAEIRRQWLAVQKIKRAAAEKLKAAGEQVRQAEAVKAAVELAKSGEDPTAVLEAAGLDPAEYYQKLTQYALSDKAKKPEDPVAKMQREHDERVKKYAEEVETLKKTLEDEKSLAQHNQAIKDHVVPLLMGNQEKYECLFAEYGQNAAIEVYKTVWEIYQETGKARRFDEVADEMETYWQEQVDKGIQAASKLKKFQNRFAQGGEGQGQSVDRAEPKRSVTLSNKPAAIGQSVSAPRSPYAGMTRDERVAAILKKFA